MSKVTEKKQVLAIYGEAARLGWVLPCFCAENQTTTEAILAAADEFARERGISGLPVIIAITCQYDHRSQSPNYTHTRRWDIGLKMMLQDVEALAGKGGPYEDLRVMVHLDHIQFDADQELLSGDLSAFSSIMYDASGLPFEENMKRTRRFVAEQGDRIVVEGACDEIVDASGSEKSDFTTPDKAEEYIGQTGVDLIVANLGTEHRASTANLKYRGDLAVDIRKKIGPKIVLHGASSVPSNQIARLSEDGICKVNLWTVLERDSTPVLFKAMVENAVKVTGGRAVQELKDAGVLGRKCSVEGKASLEYFTTLFRQNIVFTEMKKIVKGYLELWYK